MRRRRAPSGDGDDEHDLAGRSGEALLASPDAAAVSPSARAAPDASAPSAVGEVRRASVSIAESMVQHVLATQLQGSASSTPATTGDYGVDGASTAGGDGGAGGEAASHGGQAAPPALPGGSASRSPTPTAHDRNRSLVAAPGSSPTPLVLSPQVVHCERCPPARSFYAQERIVQQLMATVHACQGSDAGDAEPTIAQRLRRLGVRCPAVATT